MSSFLNRFTGGLLRPVVEYMSRQRLPRTNGRLGVPGLTADVTVQRDERGVPHISAQNRTDLFTAQGFIHAQDRLWQMALNRRVATGRLAALVGGDALDLDRLTRTLGFRRGAAETWDALGERRQAMVTAYVAGVNAVVARLEKPVEFSLLRQRPEKWDVLDVVAIGRLNAWAMSRGWSSELIRAELIDMLGEDLFTELEMRYPDFNPLTLPEGIRERTLVAQAARSAFGGSGLLGRGTADGAGLGSNGWVLSGERTADGVPILANDLHLPLSTPGIWYANHLWMDDENDDTYHATGVSMPGVPGVLVGHNGRVAWGITLAYADCEDVVIEKFDPDDETRYKSGREWRTAEVVDEKITVDNGRDHTERVIITHHGPLIHKVLPGDGRALALQSTALARGLSFGGLLDLAEAQTWADFRQAAINTAAPALNLVYADVDGNIGYAMTGRIPIRPMGDGLLPVSGWSGGFEWRGTVPPDEMPFALNPECGYIVSCNHKIVGDDYAHDLGHTWMNGWRAQRLEQLIGDRTDITADECAVWQRDVLSLPGLRLQEHVAALPEPTHPQAQKSWQILCGWDGQLTADSAGAAVYQVLLRRLAVAILRPQVGDNLLVRLLGHGPEDTIYGVNDFYGHWSVTVLRLLDNLDSQWIPAGPGRRALLTHCLAEATDELTTKLGDERAWSWGALHPVAFPHALGQEEMLAPILGLGPVPIGGDTDTVMQTGAAVGEIDEYDNSAFSVSYRQVIRLPAEGAHGRAMGVPGQSGHLMSRHYSDMIRPWLEGDFYEMGWTAAQVEALRRETLYLKATGETD